MQLNITYGIRKCSVCLVDTPILICKMRLTNVNISCKGGIYMRKYFLDNIRWITVVIVVLYHVFFMYNAEGVLGGVGQITSLTVQPYDIFQYLVYPWFMPILFIVAGISSRLSTVALVFAKNAILPAPLCYLLSLLAGFVFGYGLYALISRIPFFRWAVLGISKEQAQKNKEQKNV